MSQGMIILFTNAKQTQVYSWILNVLGNFVVQVHSLCTVISMKMEVPTAAWVNDFDGITLAESINMHLPPFIRIFGIVPVTRYYNVDEPAVILPICVPVAVVQTAPQFVYFRV
jgi:hypothetical protein